MSQHNAVEIITRLREEVGRALMINEEVFSTKWEAVEAGYQEWINKLPAPVSVLTSNLELLRFICQLFGKLDLKNEPTIRDIVLHGAINIGETVRNNRVIDRGITDKFTISYTLENPNGEQFSMEFVD